MEFTMKLTERPKRKLNNNETQDKQTSDHSTKSCQSSASSQAVLYQALDTDLQQIRLLTLSAGVDEPVSCELNIFCLNDGVTKGSYETISYAWGDSTIRDTVIIDGQEVDVPASSKTALKRMRLPNEKRVLWIDAICINQGDKAERSSQVTLMADIYSHSRCNLVWLGEGDDDLTRRAIESIQAVLTDLRQRTNEYQNSLQVLYRSSGGFQRSHSAIQATLDKEALQDFFGSRWFTRRWVVQESALAPQNICYRGSFDLPLEDGLKAAAWLRCNRITFHSFDIYVGISNAAKMQRFSDSSHGWEKVNWRNKPDSKVHLRHLLKDFQTFKNEDPKDCVFALLALYSKLDRLQKLPELITPDYNSSLQTILTKTAFFCMQESRGIKLLRHVSHRIEDDLARALVPSWVWRFDRDIDATLEAIELAKGFSADDGMTQALDLEMLYQARLVHRLNLKGHCLAGIDHVTETVRQRIDIDSAYTLTMLSTCDLHISRVLPHASREQVLGNTLCASRLSNRKLADAADAAAAFVQFENYIRETGHVPPSVGALPNKATAVEKRTAEFKFEVRQMCVNRRIFTAGPGYFGIGPQIMQVGDKLAILAGCPTPVVLRPTRVSTSEFWFVGECYVYGNMFGEAVRNMKREGRQVQEIELV